ncbi:MAG: DUF2817 domain-containing protein [Flavobacteriaceae bacterium]|jgi:hypothetical protein|nr:DUF2817 domain-containing protein [Flavobacteriaceae bacterium]
MFEINNLKNHRFSSILGRYITNEKIAPFLSDLNKNFKVEVVGKSVEKRDIKTVTWGEGKCKVFMWSQMHGNESTTTKAIIDFLHLLNSSEEVWIEQWKKHFTFLIVPILNPDGAYHYTRVNANQVDLNRDSIDLSQPESRLLRSLFNEFAPQYAFNLHDQRTIFGVGDTGKPATISFLAPSFNESCDWNDTRKEAMQLIVAMNEAVQKVIPGQVGRFDDSFNINCIGDYFQTQGVPTVLFEAGHYPNDYEREETRNIVFLSLLTCIKAIKEKSYLNYNLEDYLSIEENQKNFTDIIFKNVLFVKNNENYIVNVQYLEILKNEKITFSPLILGYEQKESKFAHNSINTPLKFSKHIELLENCIEKNIYDVIEKRD